MMRLLAVTLLGIGLVAASSDMERNSDGTLKADVIKAWVDEHNTARAKAGLGSLTWDTNLAKFAQTYIDGAASDCPQKLMDHTTNDARKNIAGHVGKQAGENIAGGYDHSSTFSETAAKQIKIIKERAFFNWQNETNYYDIEKNTCQTGKMCGHYTQVNWEETTLLGCHINFCKTGYRYYAACIYLSGGNYPFAGENRRRPFDNYCKTATCQNGATCKWMDKGDFKGFKACDCAYPYTGRDCSVVSTTLASQTTACAERTACLARTPSASFTDSEGYLHTFRMWCNDGHCFDREEWKNGWWSAKWVARCSC